MNKITLRIFDNASLTAFRIVGRSDVAAQTVRDEASKRLLVRGADARERRAAERILVAAVGQEVSYGDVYRISGLDYAIEHNNCAVI